VIGIEPAQLQRPAQLMIDKTEDLGFPWRAKLEMLCE
jgi:hypothetical protein